MAKTITGQVTSNGQDKTIVITVTSRQTHPLYGKQYTRSRKYIAHDEKNAAKIGDTVRIVGCRPISRHKSFTLESVLSSGHAAIELKEESFDVAQDKPLEKTQSKEDKA